MPPNDPPSQVDPALAELINRTSVESSSVLRRVTGTHALLLDVICGPVPQAAGFGRWTALQLAPSGELAGPLRAAPNALPFCDNSFGAVLIRHLAGAGVPPRSLATEAARVLAPHGVLLVIECHPFSAWRLWLSNHRHGDGFVLRTVGVSVWRGVLRQVGLAVGEPLRCGAPWPSTRATPRWLERACGGAWLLVARKHDDATTVQRLQLKRTRALGEQTQWIPGAHRLRS